MCSVESIYQEVMYETETTFSLQLIKLVYSNCSIIMWLTGKHGNGFGETDNSFPNLKNCLFPVSESSQNHPAALFHIIWCSVYGRVVFISKSERADLHRCNVERVLHEIHVIFEAIRSF